MKKISTLFKKDPRDLGRVINEINPENQWVFDGNGIPTRKFDGTSCAIINGELYKRYDVRLFKRKRGKIIKFTEQQINEKIPKGAISCQDPDDKSGHWPHWILCDRNNNGDKYHFEAFDMLVKYYSQPDLKDCDIDGTYELIGEKVQGNPEKIKGHQLIKHGQEIFFLDFNKNNAFDIIKEFLKNTDIEGIVFHHTLDGRMCKIRKSDFCITR